jgi:bis(5'-nucleosidyl)-tetraphosphatase
MSKLLTSYLEQIYNTDYVKEKVNVSAGIIFKEQRGEKPALLLIQRDENDHWPLFWEIPRGKCDNGNSEKLVPCLKREIKEETGLDVIPLKFIDKFQYTADKGKRLSTQHNFLCKMKNPDQPVKLSKEHQDYKWITTLGEAELLVLPDMKKSIAKAFELLAGEDQITSLTSNDFTPTGTIEESASDGLKLAGGMVAGGIAGALTGAWLVKKQCQKLYPNDLEKQSKCRKSKLSDRKNL